MWGELLMFEKYILLPSSGKGFWVFELLYVYRFMFQKKHRSRGQKVWGWCPGLAYRKSGPRKI
jgi:hypothetical protein